MRLLYGFVELMTVAAVVVVVALPFVPSPPTEVSVKRQLGGPVPDTPLSSAPLAPAPAQPQDKPGWVVVAYSQPACQGTVKAHWQGSSPIPKKCWSMGGGLARSFAGWSGDGAHIDLYADESCTTNATPLRARGRDAHGYPCYDSDARGFTADTRTP